MQIHKLKKLKEDFEDWIFKDSQRREYLVKKYNEVKIDMFLWMKINLAI